ncbi:unnamed protein product [Scytosiphon promiscuus]
MPPHTVTPPPVCRVRISDSSGRLHRSVRLLSPRTPLEHGLPTTTRTRPTWRSDRKTTRFRSGGSAASDEERPGADSPGGRRRGRNFGSQEGHVQAQPTRQAGVGALGGARAAGTAGRGPGAADDPDRVGSAAGVQRDGRSRREQGRSSLPAHPPAAPVGLLHECVLLHDPEGEGRAREGPPGGSAPPVATGARGGHVPPRRHDVVSGGSPPARAQVWGSWAATAATARGTRGHGEPDLPEGAGYHREKGARPAGRPGRARPGEGPDDPRAAGRVYGRTAGGAPRGAGSSRGRKLAKKAKYNPQARIAGALEAELEAVRAAKGETKRGASYTIIKNRGLTPHKNKLNRNPRSKKREAFRKATIRRKGQVRDIRTGEADAYGGESTGIKSNVTRSRKLKG